MLKASALYIVIVIALVIGIICSSLITAAYFYKLQYQKKFRMDRLQLNLASGVNLLLASDAAGYQSPQEMDLFGNGNDSVSLQKEGWGLYDLGIVKAFQQRDTLYKTFLTANSLDSAKWAALYLIDEDRPLSVSGKTMIRGTAFIPKAGIKEAYVDNKSYQGDKQLVAGQKKESGKALPELDAKRIEKLTAPDKAYPNPDTAFTPGEALSRSFLLPAKVISFKRKVTTLSGELSGHIVLLSDTTVIIKGSAKLDQVLVYARAIIVRAGFRGNCQLFARDSIMVEKDCALDYPSALVVLRAPGETISKGNTNVKASQPTINLGEGSVVRGTLISWEKDRSQAQTLIGLGKSSKVYGQVYAKGIVRLKDDVEINGSVFSNRFVYQTAYTLYENYLINVKLDEKGLSRYYLSSDLVPTAGKKKKILQWLETN
jgi:hypothetical protein